MTSGRACFHAAQPALQRLHARLQAVRALARLGGGGGRRRLGRRCAAVGVGARGIQLGPQTLGLSLQGGHARIGHLQLLLARSDLALQGFLPRPRGLRLRPQRLRLTQGAGNPVLSGCQPAAQRLRLA